MSYPERSSSGFVSKRSPSPILGLLRPTKRINISGNALDIVSSLESAGSEAMMLDTDCLNIAEGGDGQQDEAEESLIKRKDKGKAKASPPVDLPDVVWTRIFEFFYDSVCQSWDVENVSRNALTPLLLSKDILAISLPVLYRHPHVNYTALKDFIRCVKLPARVRDGSKISIVRHLTLRPSRTKSPDCKYGLSPSQTAFRLYTINPSIHELCGLFPEIGSFTLRDTLLLHGADAKILFDALQRIRPKKARLEIRLWDLTDSLLGGDLMAASGPNIHAEWTDKPIQPWRTASVRHFDRTEQWWDGDTRAVQATWRESLTAGRELHLPGWWIEPPGNGQAPQPPDYQTGMPVLTIPDPSQANNNVNHFTNVDDSDDDEDGLSSTTARAASSSSTVPLFPLPHPTMDSLPPDLRSPSNLSRLRWSHGISNGPASVNDSTTGTPLAVQNSMLITPQLELLSSNAHLDPLSDRLPPALTSGSVGRPTPEDTRANKAVSSVPNSQQSFMPELPAGRNTAPEASVHSARTTSSTTALANIASPNGVSSTVSGSATPAPPIVRIHPLQANRMDHIQPSEEELRLHGGDWYLHRSSLNVSQASIPPPRRHNNHLDGAAGDDKDDEILLTGGHGARGFDLAHECRALLLKLLEDVWSPRIHAFSFVALDPVASLIVRDPRLAFWVRLGIPHIRVHLPRGVNSLAIFKGSKEVARDRRRALRANAPDSHDATNQWNTASDDAASDNRVVGGDGFGGDLVSEQTSLFEIEVNTLKEMALDQEWAKAGEQMPPQVCRILVGAKDREWKDVTFGPSNFSSSYPRNEDPPASPSSSQFLSPSLSFIDLDDEGVSDVEVEVDGDNMGESYDHEAAKQQRRRMREK